MMAFQKMAKQHWTRELPEKTKALKAAGLWEKATARAATQASKVLAQMVAGGAQYDAAKEMILKEYIFLPPE